MNKFLKCYIKYESRRRIDMKPIVLEKRDEIVYKQLLDNIKSGVWKSGEKLPSEFQLCDELNVSRGTIRAALQRLKSIGLIETKHGKGTFVCPNEDLFDYSGFTDTINLTEKEYKEIAQLREAIEKIAVRNIVENGPVDNFNALIDAYNGMEKAASKFDYVELTKYDMMFHTAIIIASDNSYFIQIIRIFQNEYYKLLLESNKLLMRDYPDTEKVKIHFDECLVNHKNLMDTLIDNNRKAIEEQHKFLERNKERIDYFFQKHKDAGSELVRH
jgi:DNA-binding FadR family transcriptional regulator